jgi:2'-5' RNA ligase
MRLFIGIPLALGMKAEVNQFIEKNRNIHSGWRWTVPENLHITLKFLGEVDPAQTSFVCNRLQEIALLQHPFPLALGGVGCFPNPRSPRVLWIGITKGTESLANMAKMIDTACAGLGFASEDKPYRPHLTIARAGSQSLPAFVRDEKTVFQSQSDVHSFSLIESRLQRSGAQYETVRDFKFE